MNIAVSHTISMGHRLPSYDGICSSPHGHNITVDAVLETKSFLDFKEVQSFLSSILSDFDHAMVLVSTDALVRVLKSMSFRVVVLDTEPSTETIAAYVFNQFASRYPEVRSVTVHETAKYSATATAPAAAVQRI
jgi:6-pyruvoyl-tetrahydropterin synthase